MIDAGNTFLFAYEESIGYLPGPMSLDKDGVRLVILFLFFIVFLFIRSFFPPLRFPLLIFPPTEPPQ